MIEFWHWWIAALVLGALEVLAPMTVALWLGVAAGVVGLILLAYPEMSWQIQFIAFAVLSVGSVVGFRYLYRRTEHQADSLHLNRRAEQYLGTVHTLETPIVNGRGRARMGDTHWTVEGPDLPEGTAVRVVAVDGLHLQVERAGTDPSEDQGEQPDHHEKTDQKDHADGAAEKLQ